MLSTSGFVDDVTFAHHRRGKGGASRASGESDSPGGSTGPGRSRGLRLPCVCCGWVLVLGSDDVYLPENLASALAYQPEAVKTCMDGLYQVFHAEAQQVHKMRETGDYDEADLHCLTWLICASSIFQNIRPIQPIA